MKTDAHKLRSFLNQVTPIIESYGRKSLISEIDSAITAAEENSTILFCGEFKRGKSSVINAILETDLCPTDIGIATSTITTIKYGAVKKAVRYYGNILDKEDSLKSEEIEWDDIKKYTVGDVLEIDNTVMIELFYPSPFLKNGITIIDTPGIGGLDPRHAILTHMVLPKADVIVFVTDAGEPLTESEKVFYQERIMPCKKPCLLLLNKSDLILEQTLNVHINKLKLEFSDSTSPQIIPTSAKYWKLSTKMDDEELSHKSNKEIVLADITLLSDSSRRMRYIQLRDQILEELSNASLAINKEIQTLNATSVQMQSELDNLISQQISLATYRKDLENPASQTRLDINSIFEDARNEVNNLIAKRGGELTSVEFTKLLTSEKGLNNDGKWLVAQINDRLRQLSYDVDERVELAFKEISDKIQANIEDTVGANSSLLSGGFKELNSFTSQLIFSTAGKAGISLSVVSTLFSNPIGWAIAIAGAAALVWKSVANENESRKKSEIQQQLLPKINLAITELRNQTNNRFVKFHQNLLSVLQTLIKETEDKMKTLQMSIQESRENDALRKKTIADLEQKTKFCETIMSQMKILYSNPFANV